MQLSETDKWLFAGAYKLLGTDYIKDKKSHKYKTTELVGFSELKPAKMVVDNFNSYSRTSVDKQSS